MDVMFSHFLMYHLLLNKLHECEEKHSNYVNIFKCLPLAKNPTGMLSKTLKTCKDKIIITSS